MKHSIFLITLVLVGQTAFSQKIDYSLEDGFVAEGYDVTEYFNGKSMEGSSKYIAVHDGAKFKFSSQANKDKFEANPTKYIPQYGGYCAYAMATRKKKVEPNPEAFKIQDGQLLLFYTSWTTNTKEKWDEEGPDKLKPKADANWEKVKYSK
ncbi:MAG: YHS domain-containing (seleno)protein [Bacteroidota bacterium]